MISFTDTQYTYTLFTNHNLQTDNPRLNCYQNDVRTDASCILSSKYLQLLTEILLISNLILTLYQNGM